MKIIKQHTDANHVRIITDSYGKTFAHIMELTNQLKTDYPFLDDDDIYVYLYSGDRRKGIMGIEANVDNVCDDYEYVSMFDTTFN